MYDTARPNGKADEIAVLYRQYDGYPEGHGAELVEFLKDMVIVNGISMAENRRIANGGGCLAAQIVTHFKKEVGGFYLYPAGTRDAGEEYIYYVRPQNDGTIFVEVEDVYEKTTTILLGKVAKYLKQWKVPSSSNPDKTYTVSLTRDNEYECSCPRWTNHTPREDCKHIKAIKEKEVKNG
jgi:hypothetical protein